jgi:spore maturation protein CgeB
MNIKTVKNILVIGEIFSDSFTDNVSITLKNLGYKTMVLPFNPIMNTKNAYIRILGSYINKVFPKLDNYFSKKLLNNLMQFQPDLLISLEPAIPPHIIEKIKRESHTVVICWVTDPIANLNRQYILAAPYDILFVKEPYMVELFKNKLKKNIFYLPEACNPLWHKKVDLSEEERKYYGCDIAHVGNMYYYRLLILEQLKEYQIKIWGPVFPLWLNSSLRDMFMGKYVSREEKAKAFLAAKININTMNPSEIYGTNCRTFEIAGCGGFQIVEYRPALKKLFEIDKEIVTFETLNELKEKVAYYISHEKEREEIALKSYERAHRKHTYEQRLKTIIGFVTGKENLLDG